MQVRRVELSERELVVVQDDLLHPLLGGNKLRKLDALLPEIAASHHSDLASCQSAAASAIV